MDSCPNVIAAIGLTLAPGVPPYRKLKGMINSLAEMSPLRFSLLTMGLHGKIGPPWRGQNGTSPVKR